MSIKFSDGMLDRTKRSFDKLSTEQLKGKLCGGCVRCKERYRGKGFHCTMKNYKTDISPSNKACGSYWDKEMYEEEERLHQQDVENRRKELWNIYANKEPIKLPIVFDGYGNIPECPICGEMPYSTEQCHWCGQRFIQDEEIEEYTKPLTEKGECFICGAEITINISKYNGHKSYHCDKCGSSMME